jgi:TATA-box binding protein (TBP) (component of TFIID and TFIIIB)
MKSKKNLTRFTYETQAFEGWRLSIARAGTTFTRYFSDKKYGTGKKSLAAAEKTLKELRALIDGSKLVNGKLSATTVKKAQKLLADAV